MEPYGRSSMTTYLKDGYAHVNTDVRGSGKSGGALCLLCLREQEDVVDVVKWIERQPWSNGHVALYGYSYSAITALLGAALHPPGLDAVIVGHPPTDPYRDVVWQNGMYNQGFIDQWFAGQTVAQGIGIGRTEADARSRATAVRGRDATTAARRAHLLRAVRAREDEADHRTGVRLHRLGGHVQPRRPALHRRRRVDVQVAVHRPEHPPRHR